MKNYKVFVNRNVNCLFRLTSAKVQLDFQTFAQQYDINAWTVFDKKWPQCAGSSPAQPIQNQQGSVYVVRNIRDKLNEICHESLTIKSFT